MLLALLAACWFCLPVMADEKPLVRELYVPFEDLESVLEAAGRRVFLTREEYERLLEDARRAPELVSPHETALLDARYEATVQEGRALIAGRILLDVARDGLQAIPLDLDHVGVRQATLDGQPAAIGRADKRSLLFVAGRGRHELLLQMVLPVEVTAARQTMRYRLPSAATMRLQLTVPGDVEVRSGAQVIKRIVDGAAGVTRFDLVPARGPTTLEMTLNNRLAQRQQVVMARQVMVDELTETYERLHVTASMQVVHGSAQQFRFAVPGGFEVTHVATAQLARWEVTPQGADSVLDIHLRTPETGTVLLQLTAERMSPTLAGWQMPRLQPRDVAGCVSVLGLLAENRLRLDTLAAEGLIPVDTKTLTDRLPPSVLAAEPGAPTVRPLAAFYAPQTDYSLTADLQKPAGRMDVSSNVLLIVQDSGLEVRGGFALMPAEERIFGCQFTVEPGWEITEVTRKDQPLQFERFDQADGSRRIRVALSKGVPPGQSCSLHFHAVRTPEGWLQSWSTQNLRFPRFVVVDATTDRGAVAVQVRDDLAVRPDQAQGVTPLDDRKKAQFNLADVPTALAYRYESQPFAVSFRVERQLPRITAETYSFLKIEPGNLQAHYEIFYHVTEARTRELSFALPEDTPTELSIRGLDELKLKEYSRGEVADGLRPWNVQLVQPADGTIHLAVSFQQSLDVSQATAAEAGRQLLENLQLPLIRAADVEYQSGTIAVEGDAELEIDLTTEARKVDVGELVDAAYRPGRRLLGAFGFVGAPTTVSARVIRPEGYGVPAAVVQRGELVTAISAQGLSQTAARFLLRTKAQFLEIELPPGSTIWSALLDDKASKPQRDNDRLLISLPPTSEATVRDLQLVYETPIPRLGLRGSVSLPGPRLRLRERDSTPAVEVPLADLAWQVHPPADYQLADSHGTVFPDLDDRSTRQRLAASQSAWQKVAATALVSPGPTSFDAPAAQTASGFAQDAAKESPPQSSTAPHLAFGGRGREPIRRNLGDLATDDSMPADAVFGIESAPAGEAATMYRANQVRASGVLPGAVPSRGEQPPPKPPASPPTDTPASAEPATGPQAAGQQAAAFQPSVQPKGQAWALEGLRSLKIELAQQDQPLRFQSLGSDPLLDIRLVDQRRIGLLAWGVASLVLAVGLMLLLRPVATQAKFVVGVLIVATVLPMLLGGYRPWGATLDFALYAALALIPIYLLAAAWRRLAATLRRYIVPVSAALLLSLSLATAGEAPPPAPAATDANSGPVEVTIVDPTPPVQVPPDTILVPYDPQTAAGGVPQAERIIVPYSKYVELWNLAYPDKKLEDVKPPTEFSFAGAQWRATLVDEEYLRVEGQVALDLYVGQPVTVPLAFGGGVLEQASLDGQPARIQLVQTVPPTEASQAAQVPVPVEPMANLYASGKGRKQLTLAVRYRLERRGGWRVVAGRLPGTVANSLALTVPEAETELRLAGVVDRTSYETGQPSERMETALAIDGKFRIEWRPKVGQATVDRSLTVESDALLDVQEDGLRLIWALNLKFPLGQRDLFTVEVPEGYVVEQLAGENVRGWEVQDRRLQITLLKAARNAQSLTLYLTRRGAMGQGELASLEAPVVQISEAVLHEGRLAVRRSPLLELRVIDTRGLTRTDLAPSAETDEQQVASPLGIRAFQAYRFVRTPYRLSLSVVPLQSRLSAELQTLLRWSQMERTLESRVVFRGEGRPIYGLTLNVPAELTVDEVLLVTEGANAPVKCQWAATPGQESQQLRVFLTQGQLGSFSLVIRGKLGSREAVSSLQLPQIVVDQVERQTSTLVVQTDPGFDARVQQLQGCQTVLLQQTHAWLLPEQRKLARLAIKCPTAEYSGQLRLEKRSPRISCQTISNLAVTPRTFEETILLDFLIEDAGVGELVFLLPAQLRDARITAPLIRQKTVEETDDAGQVRIRLELQDEEVMGQFRVLVEMDRLLTSEPHPVPVPIVETGTTTRRFVALETAGREEVIVEQQDGLEPLGPEQQAWQLLTGVLGEGITQAYLVQPSAVTPRLVVRTKDREAVETVGARIPLAETVLTVDASGAYRGVMTYRVDNRTEQFLEVALPAGARLWAAHVASQPVKPIVGQNSVRIPLVKTAEGDRDYAVSLKYGGRMEALGSYHRVEFPLIRSLKIQIEESQVRLWLPATHRWFAFEGTMGLAAQESDLLAGYLKYKNQQIRMAGESLTSANPFTRLRAESNLAQLEKEMQQLQQLQHRRSARDNRQLQSELQINRSVWREAKQKLEEQQQQQDGLDTERFDNRKQLDMYFQRQSHDVGRNIVNAQGSNFDFQAGVPLQSGEQAERPAAEPRDKIGQIEGRWFDESGFSNEAQRPKQKGMNRIYLKDMEVMEEGEALTPQRSIQAPEIAAGKAGQVLKMEVEQLKRAKEEASQQRSRDGKLERFRSQLESDSRGSSQPSPTAPADAGTFQYGRPIAVELSAAKLSADGMVIAGAQDQPVRVWDLGEGAGAVAGPAMGLVSLDVQFPTRGREYLFTTPGGDTEIVARAVERPLLNRLLRLLAVVVGLAVVALIYRQLKRCRFDVVLNRGVSLLLILVSLVLLSYGIIPWLAAAAGLVGCVQLIRLTWIRRSSSAA